MQQQGGAVAPYKSCPVHTQLTRQITNLKPVYSRVCDELAVVQLDPLQVQTAVEVAERRVRDQRTVVELQERQGLGGADTPSQMTDAFVGYQFAMGQALEKEYHSEQHSEELAEIFTALNNKMRKNL